MRGNNTESKVQMQLNRNINQYLNSRIGEKKQPIKTVSAGVNHLLVSRRLQRLQHLQLRRRHVKASDKGGPLERHLTSSGLNVGEELLHSEQQVTGKKTQKLFPENCISFKYNVG